jgi:Ca-activated chloride channel homolog
LASLTHSARYVLAAFLLLLVPLTGSSVPKTQVWGLVTDAQSAQAIPGATVVVLGTSFAAISDRNGRYEISGLAPGSYRIQASYVGFQSITSLVTLSDGVPEEVNFSLSSGGILLQERVVMDAASLSGARKMVGYATAGMSPRPAPANWNTEDYAFIEENGFRLATEQPLSTFSIDVDAASYANIRRFIRDGQAPPVDAVRVEEMINYFSYDYPDPEGDAPFSVTTEMGRAPWNPTHRLVHIGLQGKRMDLTGRPQSNLVFLLDVSGSMSSPDKLPLLKRAFRMLAEEMGERDRVSIVVYAGAAGLVLPPTDGAHSAEILAALERLQAGGSTAGSAGIQLAYDTVKENFVEGGINRVILATDGDFNVGASSDSELIRMIEERREEGAFLTVLGFGTGNLKDNKMEQLADHGNGSYYYIDSDLEARKVLVTELGGTLHTIAKDVKIQVEFNPRAVAAYRLIGYENRMLAAEDFRDDRKDAGELGAGHTVTALYEIIPVGARTDTEVAATGTLRYQEDAVTDAARSDELMFLKLRYKRPNETESRLIERPLLAASGSEPNGARNSDAFVFSAAVAEFGMVLRDSEHLGKGSLEQVLELALTGRGEDAHGYRRDFISMVEAYQSLGLVAQSGRD